MSFEPSFSKRLEDLIQEVDKKPSSEYTRGYMDALAYVQGLLWEEGLEDE